ncbi:MAG: hypothetical protein GTN65_00385 [Armatimonadetes bacterium]|nr:hypothetical protein [Armatimonadota bacterium]NIO95579.1 hypothetical protein [Armatimonadota bacterium]
MTEKRPLAEAIFRWLADQNAVIEALTRLGIPQRAIIEIGNGFCCVLPGHDERRPSAALYRGDNGLILYACWHGRSGTGPDWYFPAEVLASQAYGKAVKLNRPELAAWTLRQLVEIGFLAPAPVPYVDLPAGATQAVSKVYEGFRLLLGCKWLHTPGAPSAFSWRFASAWCDVTYRLAGDAIKYLLGSGHLLPAGKQTRRGRELTVFLPGTVRDVTIRKVKTVFPGAREIHAEDDN